MRLVFFILLALAEVLYEATATATAPVPLRLLPDAGGQRQPATRAARRLKRGAAGG